MNHNDLKPCICALIQTIGSPCRISCVEIAKILGIKKHQVYCLIKQLEAEKQITYIPGHGNCKNVFYLGDVTKLVNKEEEPVKVKVPIYTNTLFGSKDTDATKKIERSERGNNVFLSDAEYQDLLRKAGCEYGRQLAISVLSGYKKKFNYVEDDGCDYRRINAWVLDIVRKKVEKKNKNKEKHLTLNIQNANLQ
jgi:hypothetical protein